MKVAMVCGSAGTTKCGVGDYTFELVQHLALDCEVHLYYDRHHGPADKPFSKLSTLHLHEVAGFSILTVNRLTGQLREGDYDIVHIQYPSKGYGNSIGPAYIASSLAGMKSRSRIVLTLHEWSTSHPLRKIAVDQMFPSIDALVVSNEEEMSRLSGKIGSRKTTVIPVGNVLASRSELESVWLRADGKPVPLPEAPGGPGGREPFSLFHYGLPAKGKGIERLLKALKLVRDTNIPAVLYLGGEFPPGEKRSEDLLGMITDLGLIDAVVKLGHIPRSELVKTAERFQVGVFPFDEGFNSKRSSIAAISDIDLPIVVGGESREEHPYLAPTKNTAAALSVLLVELFNGKLGECWVEQVEKQRGYARRFSFPEIARSHLRLYSEVRNLEC